MTTHRRLGTRCIAAGVALALACAPVFAGDAPANMRDLVDMDINSAYVQLGSRGYTVINSRYSHGKNHEYWWQPSSKTCLHLAHTDHRIRSMNTTVVTDCNQYQKDSGGISTGAKVAIGAAALLGVAALAHRSNERDEKHSQDERSVAEFERGYRDGLHHESYHNYNNASAYSDGYNKGQTQRENETRHRSPYGQHSGYQSYVSMDDLVGGNAAAADTALRSRGFRDISGYKDDNKVYTIWWNSRTRQCVQSVVKNGVMKHINPLTENNCL